MYRCCMFCLSFCIARLASLSDAKLTSASPLGLQNILLVNRIFCSKLSLPSLPIVVNEHVHGICHGTEPLGNLLLRHPEWQASHVNIEHSAGASVASTHTTGASTVAKIVLREVSSSSSRPHSPAHTSVSTHSDNIHHRTQTSIIIKHTFVCHKVLASSLDHHHLYQASSLVQVQVLLSLDETPSAAGLSWPRPCWRRRPLCTCITTTKLMLASRQSVVVNYNSLTPVSLSRGVPALSRVGAGDY